MQPSRIGAGKFACWHRKASHGGARVNQWSQLRALAGMMVCVGCGVGLLTLASLPSFAGPPFQTDDPDPVAFRHFEMYAFATSDGTSAGGTTLGAPCYEMNYGVAPDVQLHVILPLVASFAPNGGPVTYGYGDTELGVKYRLVKETKHVPEVGVFPFVELPSGNASRGLGVGSTWYRLPIFAQKSWGPWTSYGGGGAVLVSQAGYKNFPFAGWLVQRQMNKKWMMGVELFGHGAEGASATSTRSSTMADLGGSYEFREGFDLLFAAGRSVAGQAETYTYCALYWTWGKNAKSDDNGSLAKLMKIHLR